MKRQRGQVASSIALLHDGVLGFDARFADVEEDKVSFVQNVYMPT